MQHSTIALEDDKLPVGSQGEENMPARKCPHCRVLSNFNTGHQVDAPVRGGRQLSIDRCQNCLKHSYYETDQTGGTVFDVYPSVEIDVDESLPEDVKPALREAYQGFESQIWNSCVVMSRRALEEAAKDLGATGNSLIKKIDDLAANQRITPELKEWANEGRLGGNLGAHGSPAKKWADKEDAEEILEFTRWFMRYVYVLPQQLADRRSNVTGSSEGTT